MLIQPYVASMIRSNRATQDPPIQLGSQQFRGISSQILLTFFLSFLFVWGKHCVYKSCTCLHTMRYPIRSSPCPHPRRLLPPPPQRLPLARRGRLELQDLPARAHVGRQDNHGGVHRQVGLRRGQRLAVWGMCVIRQSVYRATDTRYTPILPPTYSGGRRPDAPRSRRASRCSRPQTAPPGRRRDAA